MALVVKCPACHEYGASEMATQGHRNYLACIGCGHGWWVTPGISHDEIPPTQRNSTVVPVVHTCGLCDREGVKAMQCKALTCRVCGVWVVDDHCGAPHPLPRAPMTKAELQEDREESTSPWMPLWKVVG